MQRLVRLLALLMVALIAMLAYLAIHGPAQGATVLTVTEVCPGVRFRRVGVDVELRCPVPGSPWIPGTTITETINTTQWLTVKECGKLTPATVTTGADGRYVLHCSFGDYQVTPK